MVRNLMLACVEQRFGTCRAPRPVQWLADNGSAYAAHETLDFAQPRPDALTVLAQLPSWIEDHNESHPRSGLRMRLPREFIRSQIKRVQPCPT